MKLEASDEFAKLIASCCRYMGKTLGMVHDKSNAMACIEASEPHVAVCGFTKLTAVFECRCGEMTTMSCSPPGGKEHIKRVRKFARDNPDEALTSSNFTDDEIEGDAENIAIASNVGQGMTTCSGCGRSIIGHWTIEGASFVQGMKFPWEGQESPDPSASGAFSLGGDSPPKGTLH